MSRVRYDCTAFVCSHTHELLAQLEKLLQKNYLLHQSAKDGYRAYLQSYASYSLKKIFDINALDLAKVGKAFGFAVPPRVNLNLIGGGKGNSTEDPISKNKRKRPRTGDEAEVEMEEMVVGEGADEQDGDEDEEVPGPRSRPQGRQQDKKRRVDIHGEKKVQKDFYKVNKDRRKQTAGGGNWSR